MVEDKPEDNIFTERLWRSVKYEEVYLHDYQTVREANEGISKYLVFYNQERPHQSLDYWTPVEVYITTVTKKQSQKYLKYPKILFDQWGPHPNRENKGDSLC